MCWGNPGPERPFLPVEKCWEWRKEEHSRVSFVSHLTSAPQNTNTELETRSRASATLAGALSVQTVTHADIWKPCMLYCSLQEWKYQKIPLEFCCCYGGNCPLEAVLTQSKWQCVSRLSVWTGQILYDKHRQKKQQMTSMTLRISTNCLYMADCGYLNTVLSESSTTRQLKQLLISLLQQFFRHWSSIHTQWLCPKA